MIFVYPKGIFMGSLFETGIILFRKKLFLTFILAGYTLKQTSLSKLLPTSVPINWTERNFWFDFWWDFEKPTSTNRNGSSVPSAPSVPSTSSTSNLRSKKSNLHKYKYNYLRSWKAAMLLHQRYFNEMKDQWTSTSGFDIENRILWSSSK